LHLVLAGLHEEVQVLEQGQGAGGRGLLGWLGWGWFGKVIYFVYGVNIGGEIVVVL
jgi:hypothetical protein